MAITATASGTIVAVGQGVVITLGGQPVSGDTVTVIVSGSAGSSSETYTVQQNQEISAIALGLAALLQGDDIINQMVETLAATNGVQLYEASNQTGEETIGVQVATGGAQSIAQSVYDMGAAQFTSRIAATFPQGWVSADAAQSGVASALFGMLGQMLELTIQQLQYVDAATRIPTSTDPELTEAADDFYGIGVLPRPSGYTDAQYGALILASLFPPAATRSAIENALKELTGVDPRMIEPWNPGDTGCWNPQPVQPWDVSVDFIAVPAIPPNVSYRRDTGATYIDQNGNIQQVGPNTPRFLPGSGLLIEPAGTNYIQNPTLQGTYPDLPTHWDQSGGNGATAYAEGYAYANTADNFSSIMVMDLGVGGTVTAPGNLIVYMEEAQSIKAAQGQAWTLSIFTRYSDGSFFGVQPALYIEEEDADGNVLESAIVPIDVQTGWPFDLSTMRPSMTYTVINADTAYVRPGMVFVLQEETVGLGIWVAGPQLEQGTCATSLIVPPDADVTYQSGTIEVSNRQGDSVAMAIDIPPGAVSAMVEYDQLPGGPAASPLTLTDAAGDYSTALYASTAPVGGALYWTQINPVSPTTPPGFAGYQADGWERMAVAIDTSGMSSGSNGQLTQDMPAPMPAVNFGKLTLGYGWASPIGSLVYGQIAGYISRFAVWPYRRPDSIIPETATVGWLPGSESIVDEAISFWDMETRNNPSRWAEPMPWNGFIETPLQVLPDSIGIALV